MFASLHFLQVHFFTFNFFRSFTFRFIEVKRTKTKSLVAQTSVTKKKIIMTASMVQWQHTQIEVGSVAGPPLSILWISVRFRVDAYFIQIRSIPPFRAQIKNHSVIFCIVEDKANSCFVVPTSSEKKLFGLKARYFLCYDLFSPCDRILSAFNEI